MSPRHPLHIQNGNNAQAILMAKLVRSIEAVDINTTMDGACISISVPMEKWSAIIEARKSAERNIKGVYLDQVHQFSAHIDTIDLKQAFDRKRQAVVVPIQSWARLLVDLDEIRHRPDIAKAITTEYYIEHQRFPGTY